MDVIDGLPNARDHPQGGSWQGQGPAKTLAIAEGFETAARFVELHGIPAWASLGAARLSQIDLPAYGDELIIAEDDDAEGRRASLQAARTYARGGRTIRRIPPPAPYED